MSADLSWEHQFCLACDRQTDGATYCSESCRLSEFEKSSSPVSAASSPGVTAPSSAWTTPRPQSRFRLSAAYDFSNAQPYGSTPLPQSILTQRAATSSSTRMLSPSSSNSSLFSLRSTSSTSSEGTNAVGQSQEAVERLRRFLRTHTT